MKRTAAVLSVTTLLLSACTTPAPVATTAPSPTLSSVAPDTAAPVPATAPATTTVPPLTVDGVPAEALALIGAPMPEVDLTMESPEDFERWLREYLTWSTWLSANPSVDTEVLSVALEPDSVEFREVSEGKQALLNAGYVVVVATELPVEIISFQVSSDLFSEGIVSATVELRTTEVGWMIETDTRLVVDQLDPPAANISEFSSLVLILGADGIWRLSSWE